MNNQPVLYTRNPFLFLIVMLPIVFGYSSCWAAGHVIDGVWSGTYESTYSPPGTKEILMFGTSSPNQIDGAYLSESGSAGTASGTAPDALIVLQPVAGCPEPSKGRLSVKAEGANKISYSFSATSCKGTDVGKGTAVRYDIHKKPAHGPKPEPAQSLIGFWTGTYTSMGSPKPTDEILAFSAKSTAVTGVYLSKSGATGILTGDVTNPTFTLTDSAPDPTCSSSGSYSGILRPATPVMSLVYGFYGKDCHNNPDIGNGRGAAAAALPW